MPHPNPRLDRTGHDQNFKTRLAANLNFFKRCSAGYFNQTHIHHNMLWIRRHEEYMTALTPERREHLKVIEKAAEEAREAAKRVMEAIDAYYLLPNTEQPKRTRQRASKASQASIQATKNLEVP